MSDLVKIREYKLRPNGERGACITIPETWLIEKGIEVGDIISFFASPNSDDLVLRKSITSNSKDRGKEKDVNRSESGQRGNHTL